MNILNSDHPFGCLYNHSVAYIAPMLFLRKSAKKRVFFSLREVYIKMQYVVLVMPTMLDLCSGLGGASEAFVQAGWNVIRIETNDELQYIPHTHQLNVLDWRNWIDELPKIDLVWASPPCREFSLAFNSPRSIHERSHPEIKYDPNLEIVIACEQIIHELNPKWWIVENVAGSQKYFEPIVGRMKQQITSFVLYGEYPLLEMGDFRHLKKDVGSKNPLRANIRAKIPFEISFELLKTWNEQKTLLEWI